MKAGYEFVPQTGQGQPQSVGRDFLQAGLNFVQNLTGDPLIGVTHLKFAQKPDWLECVFPCCGETSNQYSLTSTDQTVGKIIETAECCSKFCCQCWRPFRLQMVDNQGHVMFETKREYKIPAVCCMPCSRPEIFISQAGVPIGSLREPYMCCSRSECKICQMEEIDILDDQGNMIYYVTGQSCQCGVLARNYCCCRCCGPCQLIVFDICLPNHQKVGQISNIYNGCVEETYTKADKFVLNFPEKASQRDKILLINAVLAIDYDIFENTCCNRA